MTAPVLLWFRRDLRLADNPALVAAAETGRPILAVYVLDDAAPGAWRLGGAARWWLHHSLDALAKELRRRQGQLVLRRGPAEREIAELVQTSGARAVYWNRRYEPWAIEQDKAIKSRLKDDGLEVASFNALLGFEPWEIATRSGEPYRVFTPYSRAWFERDPPGRPEQRPQGLKLVGDGIGGLALDALELLPTKPDWAGGLREAWTPGEAAAAEAAARFLDEAVAGYARGRDFPAAAGTSRLSPHLHHGEISPRQIYHAARARAETGRLRWSAVEPFLRQLVWRDFAYHCLFHAPELPDRPIRREFERYPWRDDETALAAWQRGRTGYPIVDGGMRELWTTGWMHNRVRMIVGSFLTKDLLLPWQAGERWFWDTLVDADLANNAMGWQWVAGCGIDAAPYFRIFNPVSQSQKFDPKGRYLRRWVPELAALPDDHLHAPWQAPAATLEAAGIRLGATYPRPLVDHGEARKRALAGWEAIRGG
jgi:deoxyribodipyrimidine photo-lyase